MSIWTVPPAVAQEKVRKLLNGEVHLWHATLECSIEELNALRGRLSAHEQNRLDIMADANRQREFIVARAMLRTLLSHYTELPEDAIYITQSEAGKPSMVVREGMDEKPSVQFSLSHTDDRLLMGFCYNYDIGVDIECIKESRALEQLARRFFTRTEYTQWTRLEPVMQPAAFYRIWTGKEAYLKARGLGVGGGLERVEITVPPAEMALLKDKGDATAPQEWVVRAVEAGEEHAAACAISGSCDQWNSFCWSPEWPLNLLA